MIGENRKKLLFCLPYAFLFWVFDKAAEAYRLSSGKDILEKAMGAVADIEEVFQRDPLPSLHPNDLTAALVCVAVVWAFVYLRGKSNKKFRPGVEYGSARWGTKKDIAPFIDRKFANNILLTRTERIMVGRNKRPKYNINKNILVIGGSGSGKTRFHVKPNLMQMYGSYCITDPNG